MVRISQTDFVGHIADSYFQNIQSLCRNPDNSFISTMRALLFDRTQEKVNLYFFDSCFDVCGKSNPINIPDGNYRGIITANVFSSELYAKILEAYKDTDFVLSEKAEYFFKERLGQASIKVLINKETKCTIIYLNSVSLKEFHIIQAGIPVYLPWYFEDNPVTEQEKELLEALLEDRCNDCVKILKDISAKYNLENHRIKMLLSGFESRLDRRRLDEAKDSLERINSNIERYRHEIQGYLRERDTQLYIISGIKSKPEAEPLLMEYFLANKNLVLHEANDSKLVFTVKGDLTYWDVDLAKTAIENGRSTFYTSDCGLPNETIKMLMRAIFVDQTITLRFSSSFVLRLPGELFAIEQDTAYNMDGYMPNPHLYHYGCLGQYVLPIEDALINGDFIKAIDQCVVSNGDLNINDTPVMESFMHDLTRSFGKYFILPDGTAVDINDALSYCENSERGES